MFVPGAGFEPARVSPYAPQTYVYANSTTRARFSINYFFCSSAGFSCGASTGAAGTADCSSETGALSITDVTERFFEICASQIEVTRKAIATKAVSLLKKVAGPLLPKTVCEHRAYIRALARLKENDDDQKRA